MKIEGKYGFNKTDGKTFVTDTVSNFVINFIVNAALMCFAMFMFDRMGTMFFVVLFALIALFMLAVNMLSMTFMRIFNKFTPLPDGSLRDTLVAMFREAGYELSDIRVMDASRRTTKVNASARDSENSKRSRCTTILWKTTRKTRSPPCSRTNWRISNTVTPRK